jgi:hypothetical protein
MKVFEGKSASERNKIIAAIVLGVLALASLFFAFGRGMFSTGATTVTVKVSPTPTPKTASKPNSGDVVMPTRDEQVFNDVTTPIVYNRGDYSAPDPGRNIFAFYEPPPPTPYSPTPVVIPPPVTPPPTPVPDFLLAFVMPQNVYAGSKGFRIEVNGDKFTPDSRIYFSQSELPTTFISPQKLVADVPASLIAGEGSRQIIIQTPDGKKYSNQLMLNVQAPPTPQLQYVGMIARTRHNNDTAYFMEQGKQTPIGYRLNDIVGGRFRLVSISVEETIFEDVNLSFRHRVPLYRQAPGTATTTAQPGQLGQPNRGFPDNYVPYNPANVPPGTSIPGIPDNIPRYVPPPANRPPPQPDKKDADDDDTDGNN